MKYLPYAVMIAAGVLAALVDPPLKYALWLAGIGVALWLGQRFAPKTGALPEIPRIGMTSVGEAFLLSSVETLRQRVDSLDSEQFRQAGELGVLQHHVNKMRRRAPTQRCLRLVKEDS